MIVVRNVSSLLSRQRSWVISLGRFDGIHRGHQAVVNRLMQVARDGAGAAAVLTTVDGNNAALGCLRQRTQQLAVTGIDALCLVRQSSPGTSRSVAGELLAALPRELRVQAFVVGAVDAPAFRSESHGRRAHLEAVPMAVVDGDLVTSDGVRALVAAGDLERAGQMLGRPYAVGGRVVHGVHRGRQLGFPTANVRVRGLQLPPNGVYAVRFRIGSRVCDAVANLGFNPTFANVERLLETHVLDFDADLYGCYVEVAFVAYLRGERKFAGIEGLIEQIRIDCAEARRVLS